MTRAKPDIAALALLGVAGALWASREASWWSPVASGLGVGRPLMALLVPAAGALVALVALYRLRPMLRALRDVMLSGLDSLEARVEKLPTLTGRLVRALTYAVLVGAITAVVFQGSRLGSTIETRAIDLFFRLRFPDRSQAELATSPELSSARKQNDVVVVALDDETISHLGWPVARLHYARLIDAVAPAKPRSLTFDVSVVDPSRDHPEWDAAIGMAAQKAGSVGFTFALARASANAVQQLPPSMQRGLEANSIPFHESAAKLPEYSELVGGDAAPLPVIDAIAENAAALAMANVMLDGGDDVLRHSLLVARLGNRLLPSLSLRLAARALGVSLADIRVVPGSHVDLGGQRRVPIDTLGRTLVRYQGRHDTRGDGPFSYVSMWSLIRTDLTVSLQGNPLGDDQKFLIDEQTRVTRDGVVVTLAESQSALLQPGAVVSGKARYSTDPGHITELELNTPATEPDFELLDENTLRFSAPLINARANRGDASALTGKHVLVGSTALAAADLRNSPLGEIPGVEHHATMLANLLHDDFFHAISDTSGVLIIFVAAFIAGLVGVTLTSELGFLLTGLLMLMSLTGSFMAFSSGRLVPISAPPVALAGTYLVTLIVGVRAQRNARARAEHEREFVRQTFGRYLTEQVVQQLLDAPDGLRLGGKREFVTIMMTDLRGFTSMCGTMEPENVVKLLNHYLECMTRIITRYGGTIDEFIGDAILVVFGAPVALDKAEARAVACAIEMLNSMPEVNRWNVAQGLPTVEMGIGIHSGEVVLGNIGSELRAKYGIVGSTINLTSRVESFTVGGQVLISETTRERCADLLKVGASQVVSPKGVKGTMTIHEVLGVTAPFEVTLSSAGEELHPPRVPLTLRFGLVKGKNVAELTHVAHVEALSELGLELTADIELPALSDLQLRVVDGEALRPGDLYGKILKANVRPGVAYLRLTSVPPELKTFLAGVRGHDAPAPAPVPESALVST